MTGIANRCCFFETAFQELARSKRYDRPISIVYIDCDNFKFVNDKYGHKIGDKVLSTVARIMKRNIRLTDLAARMGGDEFAILLPETSADQAKIVMQKIQKTLLYAMNVKKFPVTFSIGIATFITPPVTINEIINEADKLMYEVKRDRKNGIKQKVFYGQVKQNVIAKTRFG